jgi:hypothetical protein
MAFDPHGRCRGLWPCRPSGRVRVDCQTERGPPPLPALEPVLTPGPGFRHWPSPCRFVKRALVAHPGHLTGASTSLRADRESRHKEAKMTQIQITKRPTRATSQQLDTRTPSGRVLPY